MDTIAPHDRPSSATTFSWARSFRELLRPQPLPRRWLTAGPLLLLLGLAIIALAAGLGLYWHGESHHYFGEKRFGTIASVAVLWGSAWICRLVGLRLTGTPFSSFWGWSALLFLYLGLDDLLRIHEQLDRWTHRLLGWDPQDPLTDHLDDGIVAAYLLPVLWLCWRHRRQIAQLTLMIQVMALAFLCFAGMVLLDYTSASPIAEESLKLIAGILILLGFLAVHYDPRLPQIIQTGPQSTSSSSP